MKCVEILTRWFAKWSAVFPNHPVSKLQIATYAEALEDFSLEQIEYGCKWASKDMEQFPKPGHIRKFAEGLVADREEYLGLPAIAYPEVTQAEREEALAYSRELKSKLHLQDFGGKSQSQLRESIDKQKEVLRQKGYLQ